MPRTRNTPASRSSESGGIPMKRTVSRRKPPSGRRNPPGLVRLASHAYQPLDGFHPGRQHSERPGHIGRRERLQNDLSSGSFFGLGTS